MRAMTDIGIEPLNMEEVRMHSYIDRKIDENPGDAKGILNGFSQYADKLELLFKEDFKRFMKIDTDMGSVEDIRQFLDNAAEYSEAVCHSMRYLHMSGFVREVVSAYRAEMALGGAIPETR